MLIPLSLFFCLTSFGQEKGDRELTVHVDQLRSDSGKVMVELKNTDDERVSAKKASIDEGNSKVSFDGLKKGSYAVRLFHDENSNGEMDRKGVMPNEGYGYSNNVKGKMGPPDLSEQLFKLEKDTSIRIHTIYVDG